jgi:hypothetical protein
MERLSMFQPRPSATFRRRSPSLVDAEPYAAATPPGAETVARIEVAFAGWDGGKGHR